MWIQLIPEEQGVSCGYRYLRSRQIRSSNKGFKTQTLIILTVGTLKLAFGDSLHNFSITTNVKKILTWDLRLLVL